MGIKINIGIARKIGAPNYGSRGASCNVEFELDGSLDNGGATRFQDAAQRAYVACRTAVDTELENGDGDEPAVSVATERQIAPPRRTRPNESSEPNGRNGNGTNGVRKATASQVRAIHAIAGRQRINLKELLPNWYQVARPEDLSIGDASELIDQLKNSIDADALGDVPKGTGHGAVERN